MQEYLLATVESTAAKLVAVFDPDPTKKDLDGVENMGDYKADVHPEAKLLIAIGDNSVRKKISATVSHDFGQVIHASAQVDRLTHLSPGIQVMPAAVINRGTAIGQHTIINSNATVEHDCKIGDFVHICAGRNYLWRSNSGRRDFNRCKRNSFTAMCYWTKCYCWGRCSSHKKHPR